MLLSMTGYGTAVATTPTKKYTADIKSLNSKQLDLAVRLPASLRQLEPEVRSVIGQSLERGKVEMNLMVENTGAAEATAQINIDTLREYRSQISRASKELEIPEPTNWFDLLLRLPDALEVGQAHDATEAESHAALEAATAAVKALMEHRRAEGARLEEFFAVRIKAIGDLLAQVPQYEGERLEKIRARITDGLASLPKADYDKGRLEQEMIFYIEKLDINEEKQRLAQHLRYFTQTMSEAPGQGKKLGFIAQEMGREINTLGSKSNHAEMQILVVKMKDILEQIKEQVLNVM